MSFRLRATALAVFAVVSMLVTAASASAAPTDPDLSFGSGGTVTLPGAFDSSPVYSAIQSDGKILVAYKSSDSWAMLARLNTNGSLDTSFGSGGILTLPKGTASESTIDKVIVASTGEIYVVGDMTISGNVQAALWAISPTGAADFSGGYRTAAYTGTEANDAAGVGVLPDGGPVIAFATKETASQEMVRLVHYSSAGALLYQHSFAFSSGSSTYDLVPSDLTVQPSGRIVVAASLAGAIGQIPSYMVMIGFTGSTGALDTTFGNNSGIDVDALPVPIAGSTGIASRSDGSLVAAGLTGFVSTFGMYGANGQSVSSSSVYGAHRVFFGGEFSVGIAAAPLADGKALFGGYWTNDGGNDQLFLTRFATNGSPDPTFGSGGSVSLGITSSYLTLAQSSEGKYLVTYSDAAGNVKVLRLMGDVVVPPPAPTAASAAFSKSLKSKLKASKLKSIAGTAAGTGVTKVEVAIGLKDSALLKKSKKCEFVKSSKGALKKVKAVKGKCSPSVWLTTTGTGAWSYKLKKALKPGKYTLYVRATGAAGVSAPVSKSVTLTK